MMGLFKKLFGKDRVDAKVERGGAADPSRPSRPSLPAQESRSRDERAQVGWDEQAVLQEVHVQRNAFELIQEAMAAAQRGDLKKAERDFQKGIQIERRGGDQFGYWFALGRYGSFLRSSGRLTDAIKTLETAATAGATIPAIFHDLMGIYSSLGRADDLFRTADSFSEVNTGRQEIAETLIRCSIDQVGSEGTHTAEEWLVRTEGWCLRFGLGELRFKAWGERGHIVERAGEIEKAEQIYRDALSSGSTDRKTFTRLLMILQKSKRWEEGREIALRGLGVQQNAAWEEDLRKRLARFEEKLATGPNPPKSVIQAFAVREGATFVELIAQRDVTYGARNVVLSSDGQRLLISKGTAKSGNLTCIDVGSGLEIWSDTVSSSSAQLCRLSSGDFLVIAKQGKIGEGETQLQWMNDNGHVIQNQVLPDIHTEFRAVADGVILGCRNGRLYNFDNQGKRIWEHEVRDNPNNPLPPVFGRPCPYFLDASQTGSISVYSSWTTLTAVDGRGRAKWQWETSRNTHRYTLTVPTSAGKSRSSYLARLGLKSSANDRDIRKAFRVKAMETHPDRHPNDPDAARKFREVVQAFEALSAGLYKDDQSTMEIQVEATGLSASIYGLVVSEDGKRIACAASDGSITVLDDRGKVVLRLVAGEGPGVLASNRDLTALVYSHFDGINFFSMQGLANIQPMDTLYEVRLSPHGNLVVATSKTRMVIFDSAGRLRARLEFAKNVSDIEFRGHDEILIAAGKIVQLRIIGD